MDFKSLGESIKWLTSLTNRQIIIILLAIVVGGETYIIYKLYEKAERLDEIIIDNSNRYNDNLNILQDKFNEQEKEKFRITQEAQEYFRNRVEKLEEDSRINFKELNQIKHP
jgi:glucan phosphoethanolaminetransferase (alkaline phosphatase superfamily)